jgi:hypothetical protein
MTSHPKIDEVQVELEVGLGGFRIGQWIAPLSGDVVAGESGYHEATKPDLPGAYIRMSRRLTETSEPEPFVPKSGTLTFTAIDLGKERFAGTFDVVFVDRGKDRHLVGEFDTTEPPP